MGAVAIIGAQWGDEGKGKVVDLLAEQADVVVRYAGGPNAGHTLVVGEDKLVFRLVPSGILHAHTHCVLGQGMVINPEVLLEEIDSLTRRGLSVDGRLHLSELAHVILPYHVTIDTLRESSTTGTKIGTTKRGIGPCYEDKAGRRGLRMGDLRDAAFTNERVTEALAAWAPTIEALGGSPPSADAICEPLTSFAERLAPFMADASATVERFTDAGKRVMLEGAQGTMLDVDHGTYPYVTSSTATAGGACTGAGIGPTRLSRVIGITKAYCTRVGEGPFPSELDDTAGKHLRDKGHEFGSVTGRPRRAGWLDMALLRYAKRVNGLDGLAVTKLDVLSGLDEVKMCVAYELDGERTDTVPVSRLAEAKPIYETLPGWSDDLTGCRDLDALPAAARRYLDVMSERSGLPIYLVSVGPRRDQTIVVKDCLAD
ncbi:MAG TPA: adenylosuccinate synthase [Polyangiaceae bacterium]|nr:adenylosuccinate synthase [Polyangiaceae bacterium]